MDYVLCIGVIRAYTGFKVSQQNRGTILRGSYNKDYRVLRRLLVGSREKLLAF